MRAIQDITVTVLIAVIQGIIVTMIVAVVIINNTNISNDDDLYIYIISYMKVCMHARVRSRLEIALL